MSQHSSYHNSVHSTIGKIIQIITYNKCQTTDSDEYLELFFICGNFFHFFLNFHKSVHFDADVVELLLLAMNLSQKITI